MMYFLILVCFFLLGFYALIFLYFNKRIFTITHIPKSSWLLVLGAGVEKNNQPSSILKDRLISAQKYIKKFNPKHIILSGTKRSPDYNEPSVMLNYLVSSGVNQDLIISDESGFSTFHSFVNLKNKYNPGKIIVISQRFHLYRSLLISKILGLQSKGFAANNLLFSKNKKTFWYFREIMATVYNLFRILFFFIFENKR